LLFRFAFVAKSYMHHFLSSVVSLVDLGFIIGVLIALIV